ncbi:MAG: RNA 2',3'-cyclic phosphodiesterase, partial [Lachnospiraceae bacterium]|nr:RNA 2',3'-cyclic phosphodiesterase [Lachnospiraceae bacterium]
MKDALVCMQDCMMNNNVHGNFTKEENLHLTLAFIGDYPDPDTILEVMDASDYRPVKLSLDGIGHYNEVWYAGLADNKGLQAYVK